MAKIFTEKRQFTKLDNEVFTCKQEITVGEFLDKCPNYLLMDIYQAVQSELTARYLNQINFANYSNPQIKLKTFQKLPQKFIGSSLMEPLTTSLSLKTEISELENDELETDEKGE